MVCASQNGFYYVVATILNYFNLKQLLAYAVLVLALFAELENWNPPISNVDQKHGKKNLHVGPLQH